MRTVEVAGGAEGVFRGRALVAEHAREEPRDGFGHRQRGDLTAGQDVVPDRQLLEGELLDQARVEALVAAAQEQDALLVDQLLGQTLVERPAARAQRDPPETPVTRLEPFDGFGDRFGTQQHAGSATERPVVDAAMAIAREVAEVDALDPDLALLLGYAQDALRGVGLDGFWEQGQDGKERQDRDGAQTQVWTRQRSCEKAQKRRQGPG